LRIALLQIDTTAGDLPGNASLIIRGVRQAQFAGADLIDQKKRPLRKERDPVRHQC
jgi:hypothetical protein